MAAAASGAAGGAFGLMALTWELPLSTTLMLRSIADVAASEGENPRHIDTKLACLTVFALGSDRDRRDNAATAGQEALYVYRLVLEPGVTLDLAGQRLYYVESVPANLGASRRDVRVIDSVGGGFLRRIAGAESK